MAIDPRNYDLDELRAASGAPVASEAGGDADDGEERWPGEWHGGANPPAGAGVPPTEAGVPPAAAAFEASVTRDLVALDRQVEDLERPYLPALPASLPAEMLIFEWLEFLLMQAGRESVGDALDFYESVGWIGADAAAALDAYRSGLNDRRANVGNDLDADDHRVSLYYVARLSALVR